MSSRRNHSLFGLLAVLLLIMPSMAHAIGGGEQIKGILDTLLITISTPAIVIGIGTLVVIVLGLRVMFSNDESGIEKARKGLGAVFVGIVLMLLATTLATLLYSGGLSSGGEITGEIVGLSDWIAGIAAVLGLLMIIVSALRAVISFGEEEAYGKVRTSVLYAVIGLIIIALDKTILVTAILSGSPGSSGSSGTIIGFVVTQLNFLLGFVTLIALVVVIYAGIRLVANFGNEEVYAQSKGIILRAILGLLVISLSYVMAQFVVTLFS